MRSCFKEFGEFLANLFGDAKQEILDENSDFESEENDP